MKPEELLELAKRDYVDCTVETFDSPDEQGMVDSYTRVDLKPMLERFIELEKIAEEMARILIDVAQLRVSDDPAVSCLEQWQKFKATHERF